MTTTTKTFAVGDRVMFPDDALVKSSLIGRVLVIDKVPEGQRKTYYVHLETDRSKRYRVRPGEIIPAPEGSDSVIGRPYVEAVWVETNAIVTLKKAWKDITPDTPLICHKGGSGTERIRLFRLGDTSGEYLRVPASAVTVRDQAWLAERLVEMA